MKMVLIDLDNINRGKLDKSQMPSEQQLKDLIESEKEYLAGLRQLINKILKYQLHKKKMCKKC